MVPVFTDPGRREQEGIAWTDARHREWRWVLAACAAANVLPLWVGRYLPFTDLPQHVAVIATLSHWWDPAWKSREFFQVAVGETSYLLYYLVGVPVAWACGSAERANRLLLSAIALALPYASRSLLRALGRDERLALFAVPLFWNQSLLIGFFNYLAALPVLLYALGEAARETAAPTRRGGLALVATTAALFFLHASAYAFFLPAAVLCGCLARSSGAPVAARARAAEMARRLWWLAPVAAFALAWLPFTSMARPERAGWTQARRVAFEAPGAALRNLPEALLDIWRGSADEWCLLALLAAAAALAWPRGRRADPIDDAGALPVVASWLALAALLYFAFPKAVGWLWQLNQRYAILFALLAPALLRPRPDLGGAVPLLLVAATGFAAAGAAAVQVRAFNREVGSFEAVLSRAEPGRRLLGLIYDVNSSSAKFAPFLHFASYYRARKGGVAEFSFAGLPHSPLRYRPDVAPPVRSARWEWQPHEFDNRKEGGYYDYVLVRGAVNPFAGQRGGPSWVAVAAEREWVLFARAAPPS